MRALSLSRRTVLTSGLAALANPALAERSPPGPVTLGQVSLSFYAVTEMDWQVNAGGKTPREAAAAWMAANPAQVEAWFVD